MMASLKGHMILPHRSLVWVAPCQPRLGSRGAHTRGRRRRRRRWGGAGGRGCRTTWPDLAPVFDRHALAGTALDVHRERTTGLVHAENLAAAGHDVAPPVFRDRRWIARLPVGIRRRLLRRGCTRMRPAGVGGLVNALHLCVLTGTYSSDALSVAATAPHLLFEICTSGPALFKECVGAVHYRLGRTGRRR